MLIAHTEHLSEVLYVSYIPWKSRDCANLGRFDVIRMSVSMSVSRMIGIVVSYRLRLCVMNRSGSEIYARLVITVGVPALGNIFPSSILVFNFAIYNGCY